MVRVTPKQFKANVSALETEGRGQVFLNKKSLSLPPTRNLSPAPSVNLKRSTSISKSKSRKSEFRQTLHDSFYAIKVQEGCSPTYARAYAEQRAKGQNEAVAQIYAQRCDDIDRGMCDVRFPDAKASDSFLKRLNEGKLDDRLLPSDRLKVRAALDMCECLARNKLENINTVGMALLYMGFHPEERTTLSRVGVHYRVLYTYFRPGPAKYCVLLNQACDLLRENISAYSLACVRNVNHPPVVRTLDSKSV